jgi:hypothetical protein
VNTDIVVDGTGVVGLLMKLKLEAILLLAVIFDVKIVLAGVTKGRDDTPALLQISAAMGNTSDG